MQNGIKGAKKAAGKWVRTLYMFASTMSFAFQKFKRCPINLFVDLFSLSCELQYRVKGTATDETPMALWPPGATLIPRRP